MWQYPRKTFCSVYINAAPLIVKKNLILILIQTPTWSYSWMTTIQLCLLRLFHIASVSGAWKACFVAAHVDESEGRPSSRFRCECCHSLIWVSTKHALLTQTTPLTPVSHRVLKTFKSKFMLLLILKEQHSLFNHTSLFLCYRHFNNISRPTGIKVYSLGINIYCLQ